MRKIQIFEAIVHLLKNWYMDSKNISNIDDFNRVNDFSILKLIKLHFLITAINSNEDDTLLNEFEFFAMPYGPVETSIYDKIKRDSNFSNFSLNNFKATFQSDKPANNIDPELHNSVLKSIELIKKIEPTLILSDAGSLVELTHKWSCWIRTFKEAESNGYYSKLIPSDLIKKDNKILNIELIW